MDGGVINLVDTYGIAKDTRVGTSDGQNRTGVSGWATVGADVTNGLIPLATGKSIRLIGTTLPAAIDSKSAIVWYSDGSRQTGGYLYTNSDSTAYSIQTNSDGSYIITNNTSYTHIRMSFPYTKISDIIVSYV